MAAGRVRGHKKLRSSVTAGSSSSSPASPSVSPSSTTPLSAAPVSTSTVPPSLPSVAPLVAPPSSSSAEASTSRTGFGSPYGQSYARAQALALKSLASTSNGASHATVSTAKRFAKTTTKTSTKTSSKALARATAKTSTKTSATALTTDSSARIPASASRPSVGSTPASVASSSTSPPAAPALIGRTGTTKRCTHRGTILEDNERIVMELNAIKDTLRLGATLSMINIHILYSPRDPNLFFWQYNATFTKRLDEGPPRGPALLLLAHRPLAPALALLTESYTPKRWSLPRTRSSTRSMQMHRSQAPHRPHM